MNYNHISFVDYRNRYFQGTDHVLVDVRSRMEFMQGHLPGAVNIPLHELPGRTSEIEQGKPVVVVCASGNRSMTGSQIIASAGYREVYNLQGGTMVWMMNGLPLE